MAIIKCKMCGGDIELSQDKSIGTCEYCGSTMTLPKVDDQQRAAAFDRGNHFRRLGEFDKALSVYERIVQEDENDAEAHWCCALCRFGIEYVKDPASGEYLPTCHRASFDSFLEDVDYKAALAHADVVARKQYKRDGEQIAAVQRGILATVQKEEPFDVFLCYKESDEQGQRTVDSTLAQDIYYQLTEQGRRVFFARITLEDKAGQEYEPYIFAALHSARVMVVVGSKPEYLNAVWVKNEWSRYLALMKEDHKRLLIPCFRDMDPYDLPEQLSVLQSYDMSKIGFIQDLIRGISKVLDGNKKKAEPRETVVVHGENGNLNALLKRGYMALEDREWERADEFFEQVLNLDAECASAYVGKALAGKHCSGLDDLRKLLTDRLEPENETKTACEKDKQRYQAIAEKYVVPGYLDSAVIESGFRDMKRTYQSKTAFWTEQLRKAEVYFRQDKLMVRALRYAQGETAQQLQAFQEKVRDTLEKRITSSRAADQENFNRIRSEYAAFMDEEEKRAAELQQKAAAQKEADYTAACSAMDSAKTVKEFRAAGEQFRAFGGYRDCAERVKRCEEEIARLKAEAEKAAREAKAKAKKKATITTAIVAGIVVVAVASYLLVTMVIIPSGKYKEAEALLAEGNKAAAARTFRAIRDYSDAGDRACALWDDITERETLSAGGSLTVGLRTDGTVVAAGSNASVKYDMSGWTDIVAISAGSYHAVGLKSDGTVVAAGNNASGKCDVSGWTNIVAVSAGSLHTVGLKSDGSVEAIGNNGYGQCNVSNWTDIVAISAGEDLTVGLKIDGTVVAVGSNSSGQCNVSEWTNIVAISAGSYHTVGLKADGTVVAVGSNDFFGQCNVSEWTDIVAISAGKNYTVGLRSDGTVVATGNNPDGRCDVSGWSGIKVP